MGETEQRELKLYAENDYDLYRHRLTPMAKSLVRKKERGIYDPAKAEKLYQYAVDEAAKKYDRENASPGVKTFSLQDRRAVAANLARDFEDEYTAGNYEEFHTKKWQKAHQEKLESRDLYVQYKKHIAASPHEDLHGWIEDAELSRQKGFISGAEYADLEKQVGKRYQEPAWQARLNAHNLSLSSAAPPESEKTPLVKNWSEVEDAIARAKKRRAYNLIQLKKVGRDEGLNSAQANKYARFMQKRFPSEPASSSYAHEWAQRWKKSTQTGKVDPNADSKSEKIMVAYGGFSSAAPPPRSASRSRAGSRVGKRY